MPAIPEFLLQRLYVSGSLQDWGGPCLYAPQTFLDAGGRRAGAG